MEKAKPKLAIISISLSGGGAERFGGLLSCMLDEIGYEVHNIVINDAVDFSYCGPLYNLGEFGRGDSGLARKMGKGMRLKAYLEQHQIGIVIDNRSRNNVFRELTTRWIYGNRRRFYMVHSNKLSNYFPKSAFLAKLLYKDSKLVCVSKSIEQKVRQTLGLTNTITIYNPADFSPRESKIPDALPDQYALFFGRLDDKVKNFRLLLEAYSLSGIAQNGLSLVIMGDGTDANLIQNMIIEFSLQANVVLLPFQKNPAAIVRKAHFTVLSSRYEGFPMSVVESLAVETPVVSVDCESGPREIITHELNGLLVANYNPAALAQAMTRFVNEPILYDICKKNATNSIQHLSKENISAQWKQILL